MAIWVVKWGLSQSKQPLESKYIHSPRIFAWYIKTLYHSGVAAAHRMHPSKFHIRKRRCIEIVRRCRVGTCKHPDTRILRVVCHNVGGKYN